MNDGASINGLAADISNITVAHCERHHGYLIEAYL